MNITQPHNFFSLAVPAPSDDPLRPVSWVVLCTDGSQRSSANCTWNDNAYNEQRDGIPLFWSDVPLTGMHLWCKGQYWSIIPPTPCHFFAFTRCLSAPTDAETPLSFWVYTLFGYEIKDYRVLFQFTPSGCVQLLEPLSLPFSL